ncbi:ATP-binding protein [Iamia sp. SCSIO 61187]|uniref:ATP-binding protein n=1 Tax=Iamia sp. SCSIO 61187 TaxID=2722752 RepID=UPI001C62AA1C|nr:ATP-binding protein [Iamia sp. SCSIO 61187]QYG93586.1 ATP-binding protein [Iamia sp. SCSIO 61187]
MPSLTLAPRLDNIAVARQFVMDAARPGVGDPDAVGVMASELVTNVFVHARTPVTLTVRLGPPVRVEVADGATASSTFRRFLEHAPPTAEPTALGGRGLGIVHALATRVGLDIDPAGGKVVWFEV